MAHFLALVVAQVTVPVDVTRCVDDRAAGIPQDDLEPRLALGREAGGQVVAGARVRHRHFDLQP